MCFLHDGTPPHFSTNVMWCLNEQMWLMYCRKGTPEVASTFNWSYRARFPDVGSPLKWAVREGGVKRTDDVLY